MFIFKSAVGMLLSAGLLTSQIAATPTALSAGPRVLVIGAGHLDSANQQPEQHRFFEYTDFFTRSVRVHAGDVLDIRTAPDAFHMVALASNEAAARAAYPLLVSDADEPPAIGSGLPKVLLGPAWGFIHGGSSHGGGQVGDPLATQAAPCGLVQSGQSPCHFAGGDAVESQGQIAGSGPNGPQAVDWQVQIDATPGDYVYFCFIHPGMRGRLQVVAAREPTSPQALIDGLSRAQFEADRIAALAAEKKASQPRFEGGAPGTREYQVSVGTTTADLHVAIHEMQPQHLALVQGDRVAYQWRQPQDIHTVGFPADEAVLPAGASYDCGTSLQSLDAPVPCIEQGEHQPEITLDPGTAASGALLTDSTHVVDSGLLIGTGYRVTPSKQTWSVRTDGTTAPGVYSYTCVIHDWMVGTLEVRP